MIDRIKIMANDFSPEFLLNNYHWRETPIENEPFKLGQISYLVNKSRLFRLRMLLTENLKTGKYSLSIDGSIRKWYFGKNSRSDLTFTEFYDCIEVLGRKLGLKKNEIWKVFKVTQLEIGVTLMLKALSNDVLDCFVRCRNAKIDRRYETTLNFNFGNYSLKMYDKFIEMNQNKIWSKKMKVVLDKYLMLRFEINVDKMSGTTLRRKFDTLELIKTDWNKLPQMLHDYVDKIEFVDLLSQERKLERATGIDFYNSLCYSEMKSRGIHKTIMDFNETVVSNNKSKEFRKLMSIYKSNITSERDYKGEIMLGLTKKTARLI
ncbi:phage/plasmid replication domain-containing protein [Flavobacterium terrisoli]|uniref:phage/plasmid replication domain-containing protein n=1 Tax=Flavobacterium terrisoli TaxID=3242195 RepID=UPI002542CD7C|nr:phage/plasmid replication protein [Flavobacterium buctense]